MTDRLGRADLHIHTRASDGIDPIAAILEFVEASTDLDVIAITDHERIDAALAARAIAEERRLRVEVVVGEEVSTVGGHLLALFITERVRPLRSLRTTIAEIHDQGGLAVPAHPLVPYPLCAQGFQLRRLLADEPRYRPDAIEAFNPTTLGRPWHARVVRFADEHGLARLGNSDAHALEAIGVGYTTFVGTDGEALRAAIAEGSTQQHGSFHGTTSQLSTFRRQLEKYGRDARADLGGRLRGDGSRRDVGYDRADVERAAAAEAAAQAGRAR